MTTARTTKTITWYFKRSSDEPRKRISPAKPPDRTAEIAIRTIAKLTRPQPRNPRPPARSGCVGVSSRSSRDTRKRNQAQSTNTQAQRRRKKIRTGKLTSVFHQPAGVIVVSSRSQLESLVPKLTTTRETRAIVRDRTATTTSATTEPRRRIAAARADSNSGRSFAGTRPESRKWRVWTARLFSTTTCASSSRGTTNRNLL